MYPISNFGTKVSEPEDLPLDPHWQIWVQGHYTPVTGYENEPGGGGSRTTRWDAYAYTDEAEWRADLLALHEQAMDPKRTYSKEVFVAFDAGGRVEAKVDIQFEFASRRGTG